MKMHDYLAPALQDSFKRNTNIGIQYSSLHWPFRVSLSLQVKNIPNHHRPHFSPLPLWLLLYLIRSLQPMPSPLIPSFVFLPAHPFVPMPSPRASDTVGGTRGSRLGNSSKASSDIHQLPSTAHDGLENNLTRTSTAGCVGPGSIRRSYLKDLQTLIHF